MNASQSRTGSYPNMPAAGGHNLDSAQRYCRSLARTHYENFIVGSVLIPRKYVRHLYNIYAFCRYSDDLADEIGDPERSLQLLDQWRKEFRSCYGGSPAHPALVALQHTIGEFDIPPTPFEDLISAFEQDCRVTRYETYPQLLDYCTRSANPVGRIFLWLFEYRDPERQELSDRICTALQLANFWQDVASDLTRNRVYLPRQDMAEFGCSESDIAERPAGPEFKALLRFEVERTEQLFESAAALSLHVTRRLAVDIELFRRSGLSLLNEIRKIDFDVLTRRPTLSRIEKTRLFLECMFGLR